jgi:hypothetical protein
MSCHLLTLSSIQMISSSPVPAVILLVDLVPVALGANSFFLASSTPLINSLVLQELQPDLQHSPSGNTDQIVDKSTLPIRPPASFKSVLLSLSLPELINQLQDLLL